MRPQRARHVRVVRALLQPSSSAMRCPLFSPLSVYSSSWTIIAFCTMPRPSQLPAGAIGLKTTPPLQERRIKRRRSKRSPTNLRPQNRRAEWLAIRFCSFYFVAYSLRTMLDFRRVSATLTAWYQRRFENADGPDGYPPKGLDVGA